MGKPLVKENADDKENFVDELKPGTKLMHGQYTIESFLNAGGFGITYLARDSLDRKIVIKECFPGAFCRRSRYIVQARSRAHQNELKSIVRLFVQEARSLAKLDHPNIVGVHQVFEDNDTAYMALDFVEGRDLLDTIEDPNHGLTPAQIKVILKEVLGAVGFIHEQGILHRDISPDNILINSQFHPVLIDFGAAREEATKQSRVLSALRVVKDGYSPQEFYIAGSEQSPSSDLYALAASFYHLIHKDTPPNSQARLAAIASSEPDPYLPLAGRHSEYEDSFLAAIDKALAVLPKDRLQSAQDWLDMMEGEQGNVTPLKVAAPSVEASPAAAPEVQKSKLPLLLGSVAVVALLVGVGAMMITGGEDTPAPAAAVAPAQETQTAVAEPAVTAPAIVEPTAPEPATIPELVTTPPAPAPVIVEEAAPVILDEPTPVIVEDVIQEPTTPVVVGGPVIVDEVTQPAIRPATRPEGVEVAALPEVVAEPLPEPVVTPRPVIAEPVAGAEFPDQSGNRPVADVETASVALPATPDAVNAVGAGPDVEIAAVTPGNELPPPAVSTTWSVQLPFAPATPDSNLIGEIGAITPVWVRPGLEITSVNGTPVDSIAQIPAALRAGQATIPGDTVQVTFGTRDPATGATDDNVWAMPVIQQTELVNGMRFETVFTGANWRTSVVEVPEDLSAELIVGDVLTMFISTYEIIDTRDALSTILSREVENGTDQLMFAVEREGGMWAASLNLDSGQN